MPNACAAYGCSMKSGTNLLSKVGFFTFPKDIMRRRLWQIAVRRANWTPTPSSRLCSLHFVTGRPSKDKNHPDYVPSIFNHQQLKKTARKAFRSKHKRVVEDTDEESTDSPLPVTLQEVPPSKNDEGTMTELTSRGIEAMTDTIEAQNRLIKATVVDQDDVDDWTGPPGKARWVVFVRGGRG